MIKLSVLLAAVAALAFAVTAFAAGPVNGTDRVNAARSCTALRSADATAFSTQYATFGACTSQWVQKAHADRVAAMQACRAKGLTGKKYGACVKSTTTATVTSQTTAYKNAADQCASELKADQAAFMQKYGTKHSQLRNAFGKCVSQLVKH